MPGTVRHHAHGRREAPEGQWVENHEMADKIGENFMDRIQQASRARLYLQQWTT